MGSRFNFAVILSFFLCSSAHGESFWRKHVIEQVTVSYETGEILIGGKYFSERSTPDVQLGGTDLEVTSYSGNHIVATLPERIAPGTYLLRVSKRKRDIWSHIVAFNISIKRPEPGLPEIFSVMNNRVGIGTSIPEATLDVSGDIRAHSLTAESINAERVTTSLLEADAIESESVSTSMLSADELSGPWDHSENGFIRLGDIQICWGVYNSTQDSTSIPTVLPAPFLDGGYEVVVTPRYPVRFANVREKFSDAFFAQSYRIDGYRAQARGSYIAIGRWR